MREPRVSVATEGLRRPGGAVCRRRLGMVLALARLLSAIPAQAGDVPVFAKRPDSYPDAEPGYGYPGRIVTPSMPAEIETAYNRLGMRAGVFQRAALDPARHAVPPEICPDRLTFAHYAPTKTDRPCPLLLFIPGTGSQGDDPALLLRQSGFYSKVLGEAFQNKHPCHLFVPLIPKGMQARSFLPGVPHPLAALICDAMFAAAARARPPVDRNRLYVTGLSFGGNMAFDFCCAFPGRFAASVPIAALQRREMIPARQPGRYWLLYNEGDFRRYRGDARVLALQDLVVARGGEFRIGCYPEEGHNAWSAAWQEDRVWDWLFSKTADDRAVGGIVQRAAVAPLRPPAKVAPATAPEPGCGAASEASGKPPPAAGLPRPLCSASQPGSNAKSEAQMGADGLDGTCYVSSGMVSFRKPDWWMVTYPAPVKGRVTVLTGDRSGAEALERGEVEVSISGEQWTRARSVRDGTCTFSRKDPFRFLRVVPRSRTPQPLVIREVIVEDGP